MNHVREFIEQIHSNQDFCDEIRDHGEAIESSVDESLDVDTYRNTCLEQNALHTSGLLDYMQRRVDNVLQQLKDLDN